MKEYIRSIAVLIAVAACFLVAILGAISKVEPAMCCYRAICGAVFAYCIATVALHIVARIVLTALVDSKVKVQKTESDQ